MFDRFIGREKELADLNKLYEQNSFQMFILYGRRRVGKTTLLGEFCKGKDTIFFAAEEPARNAKEACLSIIGRQYESRAVAGE